jgi:hypothetical protein
LAESRGTLAENHCYIIYKGAVRSIVTIAKFIGCGKHVSRIGKTTKAEDYIILVTKQFRKCEFGRREVGEFILGES